MTEENKVIVPAYKIFIERVMELEALVNRLEDSFKHISDMAKSRDMRRIIMFVTDTLNLNKKLLELSGEN
jgi:hypothetical protein